MRLLQRQALTIALIYALFGVGWILFSDRLLASWISDVQQLTAWQTYKGWFFVGASTLLVYLLLAHANRRRQDVQSALTRSQIWFEALVEGATDYAMIVLDWQGVILAWNSGATQLTGYQHEEALGRTIAMLYPPEAAASQNVAGLIEKAQRTGRAEDEGWRVRKDGSRFWANSIYTPLRNRAGTIEGFAKITHDVTERRRAELHIRRLNRFYAVLSEVNQAIVRVRDDDALLARVCTIAIEQGGLKMAWIGRYDGTAQVIRPVASDGDVAGYLDDLLIPLDNSPAGQGPTATTLRTGQHVIIEDIEHDPHMVPWRDAALARGFRASAAFPLMVAGEHFGTLNLYAGETGVFDTEEVRLLDEMAADLSFALEFAEQQRRNQAIEASLRASEDATARAQAADRLKSAFLATMSHELRTPLNSIIGFTGVLLQGLAGPLNPEQHRQLEMVYGSARHLLALINDVLDISKIEAGQLNLASAPFDMRLAIEAALRAVIPQAQKKGIEIGSTIASEVGPLTGDRRRVEQVLINLLSNAVKFTEAGSVHVDCQREGNLLLTRVSDTGIGIRQEDQARLFQPFQQIETGLARRHEGTGLGLSICANLVRLMGGTMAVASAAGAGSTFSFTLPIEGHGADHGEDSNHRRQ